MSINSLNSILFVELLGGIGDVLIALPAIQALGRSHPSAQLTVLTFAPGSELLQHNPLIHQVVHALRGEARQAVDEILAQHGFDLIVSDTNYDGISNVIENAGAKRVVTNLWRNPPSNERVGDRFLQILLSEGLITPDAISQNEPLIHLTSTERTKAREALGASYRPLVCLCPDAGMSVKRWQEANFITLGQALQQQYGATVIVPVGADLEQAGQIVKEIGGTAQVWQRGTLRELAAVMAEADLVVAADTGPARIAAALNIPTITLFGPSWYGRYGQASPHVNLQGYPECPERLISNFTEQRCWYGGVCPFDQWDTCLEAISPKEVLAAAAIFLERTPRQLIHGVTSPPIQYCSVKEDYSSRQAGGAGGAGEEKTSLTEQYCPLILTKAPALLQGEGSHINLRSNVIDRGGKGDNVEKILFTNVTSYQSPPSLVGKGAGGLGLKSIAPPESRYSSPENWRIDEWQNVRNILVMRLDNIGDVIMTSPALRAIKENLPQAKITLMASPGGALTAPLLPWVDEVLPWRVLWQDLGRLEFDPAREWELIETLSDRHFDAAIIFTSFSQSPHPAALVCYLAGIPLRLGESKELGLGVLTDEVPSAPDELHQVERNLRLIESVGFKVSDRRLTIQIPTPHSPLPTPYMLLNPWTSCQSRNYDPERFAAAARQLSEITGLSVVVTGVEKDRDRSRPILDALGDCAIDMIGATNLSELAALIANAKLVLTNNTSTMHIADATNTPSVILFAGTELECQWHPRHCPSRLLRRPTVCSPCYAFTCPYELQCLDIPPEEVVAAGLELLQE